MPPLKQTCPSIRKLGDMEHFVHETHQYYSSFRVAALYKLSQPISISILQQAAQYIRSIHPMLQVNIQTAANKKSVHYFQANHLSIYVKQYDDPKDPHQLLYHLLHGQLSHLPNPIDISDNDDDQDPYLPWSLNLSYSSDHVIFLAPHSYVDGMSLEIIGSDLVYFINGHIPKSSPRVFPPPVEKLFGSVPLKLYAKQFRDKAVSTFQKLETAGIDIKHLPRDWTQRNAVVSYGMSNMRQISLFHEQCRQRNFSLNSGIASIIYEIIARTPPFDTIGRMIPMTIPLDARKRVGKNSALTKRSIGPFLGSCSFTETGNKDMWETRARNIHQMVHGGNPIYQFAAEAAPLGLIARNASTTLPFLANGKDLGRMGCLYFSNLGRTRLIDKANRECDEILNMNDQQAVQIEEFYYDQSGDGIGYFINFHIATVGDKLCWTIRSYEPLVSQKYMDSISDRLRRILSISRKSMVGMEPM